ncbi:hypothetical protein VKT23_014184 [Stygiomarasmius scandens]|uniref:Uncharacterized protein n=1 Tax=Marasmiellus scandens TaxID=2682957 RepID=A0ABR1J5E1_9AGAR
MFLIAAAATSAKSKGKAKASRARQTEATGRGKKGARKKAVENGSDDDDEPLPKARQKRSTAVKFKATAGELSDREEGDKEEEPEVVSRRQDNKKPSKKPKEKPQPTVDNLENAPSKDRQTRRGAASSSRSGKSRAENSGLDHDPDVPGESEKGERKGKAVVAKGKGRKVIESEAEDDPEPDTLAGNASALRKEENRHKPSVTEDGIASNDGELSTEIAKKASAAEGNKADTGSKKSKTTKAGTQSALHMDFSTMKPTKRRRDDAEQLVITKRPKINHESQAEDIVEKEKSTNKPKASKALKVVPEKSTAADSPASKKRRRAEVSEFDSGAASRNETTVPENQVEETVEEPVKKRSRTGKGSKSRKGPDAEATPTEDKTKPPTKPR